VAGSWVNFSKNYYNKLNHKKYINYRHEFKNKNQLIFDFNYLNKLKTKILKILTNKLNKFHGIKESEKYWNLIIGFWLQNFLQITYLRWKLVANIEKKYKLFSHYFIISKNEIIPRNCFDFYTKSNGDKWNANLISKILKYNKKTTFLRNIKLKISSEKVIEKNIFYKLLSLFSSIIKSRSIYLSNTYIGFVNELKVLLFNKQLPFFVNDKINKNKITHNVFRENFFFNLNPCNDYEKFLELIIVENFPQSYLEDFKYYKKKSYDVYPKNTKVIVTAVKQNGDDLYSIWVAENIKKNSKYVILQHGEKGTYVCDFNTNLETEICNYYLTWGWKNKYQNTKKFFFIKNFKKKNILKNKITIILQAFGNYPDRYRPNLLQDDNLVFFIKQIEFIKLLSPEVKRQLIIRLPYPQSSFRAKDYYRKMILEIYPEAQFDDSLFMQDIYNKSKLVITSYLSTSYLESLYLDIPTVCVMNKKTCIPNKFSNFFFKKMRDSELIIDDIQKAANLVNRIYDDPNQWFRDLKIKKIITLFKKKFCRRSFDISSDLSGFIKSIK
jgi:putative transferase (TIGR04331 family)